VADRHHICWHREVDKFCETVDDCMKARLRSGTSATAQALHMRQQAYDALDGGRTKRGTDEAATTPPALGDPRQTLGSQQSGQEASASGRRKRQAAAGQVSSVDSALKEARSYSLEASNGPGREGAANHGPGHDDVTTVRTDAISTDTEHPDAAACARYRHAAGARQHPEAALMAARKLVGHAIFGLEVRCWAADRDSAARRLQTFADAQDGMAALFVGAVPHTSLYTCQPPVPCRTSACGGAIIRACWRMRTRRITRRTITGSS